MNLSPQWVGELRRHGVEAVHWSSIGDPRATDRTIMQWAAANGYAVFTHDLDFGAVLAATQTAQPTVIQIRVQMPLPELVAEKVVATVRAFEQDIEAGAVITIEPGRTRVRVLPLKA